MMLAMMKALKGRQFGQVEFGIWMKSAWGWADRDGESGSDKRAD